MKKLLTLLLLFVAASFFWVACTTYSSDPSSLMPQGTPTPSLLPESMRTADAARLSAELTKHAGEGEMTDLTIRSTQVSLELTQAVATEQYFARQTEVSINLTSTQSAIETSVAQANSTSTAVAQATGTAIVQANLTSTAVVRGTTTAESQNSVYAQATNSEIDREMRSEENTLWFSTWAPRVFLTILFIMGLVGAGVGGKALWDARWIIAAHLGVIRWGPDGKPYFIAPAFNEDGDIEGITFVEPDRMLSSGISIMPGKTTEVDQGVSENTRLLTTSGAQQISHQLAAGMNGNGNGASRSTMEKFIPPTVDQNQSTASRSSTSTPDVKILVLPPGDSRISDWVDEATATIIDAEEVRDS